MVDQCLISFGQSQTDKLRTGGKLHELKSESPSRSQARGLSLDQAQSISAYFPGNHNVAWILRVGIQNCRGRTTLRHGASGQLQQEHEKAPKQSRCHVSFYHPSIRLRVIDESLRWIHIRVLKIVCVFWHSLFEERVVYSRSVVAVLHVVHG